MHKFNSTILLVRFSEIAIKSTKTRKWLTTRLVNHMEYILKKYYKEHFEIVREYSRIYVVAENIAKVEKILTTIVPGIANTSQVYHCFTDIEKIKENIQKNFFDKIQKNKEFAVKVRRVGKHDFSSIELAAKIGEYILEKNEELKVNLTEPQYTLNIEVRGNDSYIFDQNPYIIFRHFCCNALSCAKLITVII